MSELRYIAFMSLRERELLRRRMDARLEGVTRREGETLEAYQARYCSAYDRALKAEGVHPRKRPADPPVPPAERAAEKRRDARVARLAAPGRGPTRKGAP